MITGDADSEQDQAPAQAQGSLRAAPDTSVMRVLVLKEKELGEREKYGKKVITEQHST